MARYNSMTYDRALLLIGIKRASKDADGRFQYGYGRERFVWALMSAVGIFFLGCGFTVMHGIEALQHPEELNSISIAMGVLGIALILDLSIFTFAFRSLWKQKGDTKFLAFLKTEADPSEVAVLLEDGAATLGVLIAMSTIGLTILTGELYWDAIGSILIGLLLGVVAIWLINRNLKMLVGPSISRQDQDQVLSILERNPIISSVQRMRTQALDTDTFDVELNVTLSPGIIAGRLQNFCQKSHPNIVGTEGFDAFQVEYTKQVIEVIGKEIDNIEVSLAEADEAFRFVDIEIQSSDESDDT